MVRPMVHSVKHYVQYPFSQITTGARETIPIVTAVQRDAVNLANEVIEGSHIKAVYFEMWIQNEGNLGSFIFTITKDPDGSAGPTVSEMASLMTFSNKKNILYTSQGLTSNDAISGPVNIIRTFLKIPKSKQRFGLGDSLNINLSNVSANDLNRCGFSTYKEYS